MALLKTNTGIGTTNPTSALHVIGDVLVTGVVTSTTFNGNINSGVATITTATITNLTNTRLISGIGSVVTLYSSNSYINVGLVTEISGTRLNYIGVGTITTFDSDTAFINNLTSDYNNVGVGTFNILNVGIASIANLYSPSAAINVGIITDLTNTRLTSGIATITDLDVTNSSFINANVDNLYAVTGIVTNISGIELNYTGVGTITTLDTDTADINNLRSNYIDVGVSTSNILNVGIATINDLNNTLLNVNGIGSIATLYSPIVNINVGLVTEISGTRLNYIGVGTITTFDSDTAFINNLTSDYTSIGVGTIADLDVTNSSFINANVDNLYAVTGIVTDISGTNLSYTGVGTITTLDTDTADINNLRSNYIDVGISTSNILNSGIGTINNLNNIFLNVSGVSSIATLYSPIANINVGLVTEITGTRLNYTGVGTITNFKSNDANIGNLDLQTLRVAGLSTFTNGPVLIGSGSQTGTINQTLQVTGGAYISTYVGIGYTDPFSNLAIYDSNGAWISLVDPGQSSSAIENNNGTLYIRAEQGSGNSEIVFQTGTSNYEQKPSVSGSNRVKIDRLGALLVNIETSSGVSQQNLQVVGGAYVSGYLGIGNSVPTSQLYVQGDEYVTGVITATTFNGNINATGINTLSDIRSNRITVTGIVTANSFRPTSGFIQAADGTNSFYIYDGTGNVAFQGTIGVNQINNGGGYQVITFNEIDTRLTGNLNIAGVTTSSVFNGNIYSLGVSTFRNGPVLIGTGTSTGTAFQPLQVTGGGYISDNLGLGLISPTSKLDVVGDGRFTGVVTATRFDGDVNAINVVSTNSDFTNLNADVANIDVGIVTDISGTRLNYTGVGTISTLDTDNATIDYLTNTDLTVTGIATVQNLNVLSDFNVYDTTATFYNNVFIAGNLSIGGTSSVITAQDLLVLDKEITLGITTNAFNQDVSNDITANHGGISIASTVGYPLVNLSLAGFSSLPPTYKQLMWVAANSYGVGTTDAWMFNYAVGIGSTQVPNDVRLAVGEVQITDRQINAVTAEFDRLISGIATFTGADISNLHSNNLFAQSGIITDLSGIRLNYTGFGTITNLYSADAYIDNIASNVGFATVFTAERLNVTGVGTITTLDSTTSTITNLNVTNSTFTNVNVDNLYAVTGIVTTLTSTHSTLENINSSGISTLNIIRANTINSSGVVTAPTFVGDLLGVANYAHVSGYSTFSGYSDTTGFSTFSGYTNAAGVSTFADYANNAGIATYTWTAGVSTYSGVAGYSTFSGYSDTTGFSTFSGYANAAGVSTFADYANNAGIATYAWTAGVSTYSGVAGYSTFSGYSDTTGFSTFSGYSNTSGFSTFSGYSNKSGFSTFSGYSNISGFSTFANYTNVAGISTYAVTSGVSTYSGVAGYSTFSGYSNTSGFSTFSNYSNASGIATYTVTAGVSTNVIGGIASVTQLNVTGVSTVGFITATQLFVSGIATINQLGVKQLSPDGVNYGPITYVPVADGVGTWSWQPVTQAGAGTLDGIVVREEGSVVGTAGSITDLDFRGNNIIVTATPLGAIATITVSDTPIFNTLNVTDTTTLGFATISSLYVSGVSTFSGIATFLGNVYIGGDLFVNNDIVFDEFTARNITATGISSLNIITANEITSTGIITAPTFVGDLMGIAKYADASGFSTFSGYANSSGVSTFADYANNAGIATYAWTAGVSTYSGVSGFSTFSGYSDTSGFSTFSGYSNTSGFSTFSGYSDTSGFSTFSRYSNNAGISTYAWTAGVSTYSGVAGYSTFSGYSNVSGYSTFSGYSNTSGVSTFSGYANNAGISTYAWTAGVSTYSGVAGYSTFSGYSNNAGITTYAVTAGVATYSGLAGVSTSVIGGIASITQLNVTGVSTFIGNIIASSATFSGNVTIGGTLTYEDVTNVDAIGVITARSDVRVGGNLSVVGLTTLASAGGITTTGGNLFVGNNLDVKNDINFNGLLYQNGRRFTSGIGIGSTSVNPQSGIISPSSRIGIGFTDINFVGTGLSITGYGSTVVIDLGTLGGTTVSISTIPPGISTSPGSLWWDSENGDLKIYYNDNNSAQWIDANGGSQALAIISETSPAGYGITSAGTLWWDSTYGILKVYYNDGDSTQWVDANSGAYINFWVGNSAGIHTLGNVGVGTTNPTTKLQVSGSTLISGTPTLSTTDLDGTSVKNVALSINPGIGYSDTGFTYTSQIKDTFSANQNTGNHTSLAINSQILPTENATFASHRAIVNTTIRSNSSDSYSLGTIVSGSYNRFYHYSTLNTSAYTGYITGTRNDVQLFSGSAGNIYGSYNYITLGSFVSGANRVTAQEIYGGYNYVNVGNKNDYVNTVYGTKYEVIVNNTGIVTNYYGIHLSSVVGATGTIQNNWSVYSQDTSAKMYHAGNVGVGTTNPTEKLQVNGQLSIDGNVSYGTTIFTTSSIAQVGIHSALTTSTYRSVEYTIQATEGTNFHTTKILALHDGSAAYHTEYGTIFNNVGISTYDVDVSGGNIRLLATPTSSSTTTFKITYSGIKV